LKEVEFGVMKVQTAKNFSCPIFATSAQKASNFPLAPSPPTCPLPLVLSSLLIFPFALSPFHIFLSLPLKAKADLSNKEEFLLILSVID
jgi:hypothetical protein